MNRRHFLKTAGSAALFSSMGIVVSSCNVSDAPLDLPEGIEKVGNNFEIDTTVAPFSNLRNDGSWLNIEEIEIIIVNIDGITTRAFSNKCPHQGCQDAWLYRNGVWQCNCHNSRFTDAGVYIEGPANGDLTELNVSVSGNIITVQAP